MRTPVTIKERPITFTAESVLGILAGTKTQTRRVIKWKPYTPGYSLNFSGLEAGYYHTGMPSSGWVLRSRGAGGCWNDRTKPLHCPFGLVGDGLWVRETWKTSWDPTTSIDGIKYKANDAFIPMENSREAWMQARLPGMEHPWRSPRFLPRWASRISLVAMEVRVQRLQDISEGDARAEGLAAITKDGQTVKYGKPDRDGLPGTDDEGWPWQEWDVDPRKTYARLWNHINGRRTGCAWDANPWVWALTFRRVQRP